MHDAVAGSAPGHDFEGAPASGGLSYDYDARGNLVADALKGLAEIAYSPLNLPTRLTWGSGAEVRFTYTATGRRVGQVREGAGRSGARA